MQGLSASVASITTLLSRVNDGQHEAFDELMPLVYNELHRIAEAYLRRESQDHTLQPTALIHEAYLRLAQYGGADYQSRKHFFAVAARVMRRILVDYARTRHAAKRGAAITMPLERNGDIAIERDPIVISVDDALTGLACQDEGKARLLEMRFFGGLTAAEIADCTGTPVQVVRRELRSAQLWLRHEMGA